MIILSVKLIFFVISLGDNEDFFGKYILLTLINDNSVWLDPSHGLPQYQGQLDADRDDRSSFPFDITQGQNCWYTICL